MLRPEALRTPAIALFFASLASALGQAHVGQAQPPRIERSVERALRLGSAPGTPHASPPGHADVVIELRNASELDRLVALEGVEVARGLRGPIAYGPFVSARIDAVGLASLTRAGFVDRVRSAPPRGIPPLERSGEHLGLPYVRGLSTDGLHGQGVLIADLDTPIDVFHPAFFFADAGYYDWLDVDRNGRFGPGDAIDVNRDGAAQPEEIASILSASPVDFGGVPTAALRPRGFDPSIDWLFLDVDGNGVRTVGFEAGWNDTAPGLGEPVFVPDDVDRDRVLDRAERVVQLGTSKVRAARVDTASGRLFEYARGTNLSEMQRDFTGGVYGYSDTLHGSGVAGILVADVPLIGRRWVGIAPSAELLMAADLGATNVDGLMWALDQSPDVMVHEYVSWTEVALDGSDPNSALIDASTALGVAHACPAGNIGGAQRHAMSTLSAGATTTFTVDVTTTYLQLSVYVPVGTDPALTLVEPDGARHPFTVEMDTLSDGTALYRAEADGVRTFRALTFAAYNPSGPLPGGAWQLEASAPPEATEHPVHVYVTDEFGFSGGSTLRDATDVSTLAWPSTADACLTVGAYPSHTSDEGSWFRGNEGAGVVRDYSARGPRLDGARTIGVVAPDNPWSVLGAGEIFPSSPGALVAPEGAYQVFGGTSGAGPHVGGVLALLAERGVHGAEAVLGITSTAHRDAITGTTPNDDYGLGRLDGAAALGVARTGEAPTLRLELAEDGAELRVSPSASDPDGSALLARWNLDYDGTWDTELGPLDPRSVALPAHLKVEVVDADGRRDQAVIRIDSLEDLRGMADAGVPDGGILEAGTDAGMAAAGSGCGCRAQAGQGGIVWAAMLALVAVLGRRRSRDVPRSPVESSLRARLAR